MYACLSNYLSYFEAMINEQGAHSIENMEKIDKLETLFFRSRSLEKYFEVCKNEILQRYVTSIKHGQSLAFSGVEIDINN
jgi:hypothetical protein